MKRLERRPGSASPHTWLRRWEGDDAGVEVANAFFMTRDALIDGLSARQCRLVVDLLLGSSAAEAAANEGITPSAASQTLKASGAYAIAGTVALPLILSGSFPEVGGHFARWFRGLPVHALRASPNQVAVTGAGALFLLHTTNRVIRLVLNVVGAEVEPGLRKLKGGRYIGPIERLIVGALMLAGSLEGAGLIIAAKGFIRLPEIRSETENADGEGDAVAEYFLIGTLTSIAIAAALAALVLACH